MLTQFLNRLLELKRPETVEIKDQIFSTEKLHLIADSPSVNAIEIHSLTGIVDYIKSNFDNRSKLLIHIESPTELRLIDALDNTNDRRVYLKSEAILPQIIFDRFIDRERFQIMMQANFVETPDQIKVLDIISHIHVDEGSVEVKDSGLTQTVTVKAGAASLSNEAIPPRVMLKPFRSFSEVAQPPSDYILRLNNKGEVAIFEADGGSWQLEAIENIAEFFQRELTEEIAAKNIHVLR